MSQPAVGIDLGTTYSALAVINPAGRPEIVANADGERITASAVYFEQGGAIRVGQIASDAAAAYPDRVVRWVKRKMGDPNWHFDVDGKSYSAVDISTRILGKVKADAEQTLGPFSHAVVTVPAYFDEIRRKATMDAAADAGIDVLSIINEPTAAALAYAAAGQISGRVLIYDFGGGTFDVSIVDIRSPQDVVVLCSEGDHELGGYDLDKSLSGHFDELFKREKGVNLLRGDDPAAENRIIAEAERTKRALSSMQSKPGVFLNWQANSITATVDREQFEKLVSGHIVRTEMLIEEALSQAGVKPTDIDAVLLVGGSTRIPAVQRMLKKKFDKPLVRSVNPDEAVALGAAIQAGILMEQRGLSTSLPAPVSETLRNTRLQDVTNHGYGVIYVGEAYGQHRLRNMIMIRKNSPIPCSRTESFFTISQGQTHVHCTLTQGEDVDAEFVNVIRECDLELPPDRPESCEIQITYSYDANERMSCVYKDVLSGRTQRIELEREQPPAAEAPKVDFDEAGLDDLVI